MSNNAAERDAHLDAILESLTAIARLDFDQEAPERGLDDRLDALALGVNMLREELRGSIVSRRHLDDIVQALGDALLVLDERGNVRSCNDQAEALWERPREALLSCHIVTLIPALDWGALRQAFRGGAHISELEIPGGKQLRLSLTALPDGGYVAVCVDISAHRELAQALEQARDDALALAEQRSMFLANMSHEIRTPINGVIGMTGLLIRSELDSDQRDMAMTVDTSARALLDIINDVLDFARIESGRLELETLEFDLRTVVEDVLEMHAVVASRKGLELIGSVSAEVPELVIGDPSRIRQVLTNLTANAVKFTERGEVGLFVSQTNSTGPLLFQVQDTGVGIPPNRIDSLFEAFVQADGSTTRRYGGSGLGLAICKELVTAMGGKIGCTSTPGVGSRFTVSLPLGLVGKAPSEAPDLAGVRVLVVDDNATNRDVLSRQLLFWGAQPTVAASALEAFGILREANARRAAISIALLDMQMPGRDGLSLAQDITRSETIIPPLMVLLTSLDTVPRRPALARAGIAQVMHKPIRERLLHRVIGSLLRGQRVELPRLASPLPRFPGARVLVVEDNPINQRVVLGYLSRMQILAVCAGNGAEAVELAESHWDLILMDVRMPVMDGYHAARAIRAADSEVPIVALSADVLPETRLRCAQAGMNGFIAKPVTEPALVETLAHWLGDHAAAATQQVEPPQAPSPPPRQDLVDPEALGRLVTLERVGDQPGLVDELIDSFVTRSAEELVGMRQALAAGDAERVILLAHSLRGSSLMLGAVRVAMVASLVEASPLAAESARHLDAIERLVMPTVNALRSLETER